MNDEARKQSKAGTGGGVVPDAVRGLLEQRATYREWLSRLDDVGSRYRPEVAERVRVDYRARLESVGKELEAHRHELASTLEERRARLDELSGDFERRAAELEEAELRFQVGEYDESTWEERRAELTGGLEDIEAELDGARGAVAELERVLGELDGTGTAGTTARNGAAGATRSASAGAAARRAPAAPAEPVAPEPEEPPEREPEAPAGATRDDEEGAEPAEVRAESEEREPEMDAGEGKGEPAERIAATARSAGSQTRAAAEEDGSEDYLDELEFLESLSLDDPDSFDAVSRMLEDEEDR